jgi:hypothetical protein
VSNRCAHLRESYRTLRDGSLGVTLSQALRARLRSHRPSGTFRKQALANAGIQMMVENQPNMVNRTPLELPDLLGPAFID